MTREQTYEYMNATMPDEIKRDMHVLLITHGRQVGNKQLPSRTLPCGLSFVCLLTFLLFCYCFCFFFNFHLNQSKRCAKRYHQDVTNAVSRTSVHFIRTTITMTQRMSSLKEKEEEQRQSGTAKMSTLYKDPNQLRRR